MKKWMAIVITLVSFLFILFFRGYSRYYTVSHRIKNSQKDSAGFPFRTLLNIGRGSKNSIPIVKLYMEFYGRKYLIMDYNRRCSYKPSNNSLKNK